MFISHFPETFRVRASEWLLALILTGWGFGLFYADMHTISLLFGNLFTRVSPAALAAITFIAGALRLAALLVNGLWRRTPYIRMFMAMASGVLWVEITLGLWSSGIFTMGCVTYPIYVVFEIYHTFRASADGRCATDKYRAQKAVEYGAG